MRCAVSNTLEVNVVGCRPGLTGRRAPLSWEARFWESIDALVVFILCSWSMVEKEYVCECVLVWFNVWFNVDVVRREVCVCA